MSRGGAGQLWTENPLCGPGWGGLEGESGGREAREVARQELRRKRTNRTERGRDRKDRAWGQALAGKGNSPGSPALVLCLCRCCAHTSPHAGPGMLVALVIICQVSPTLTSFSSLHSSGEHSQRTAQAGSGAPSPTPAMPCIPAHGTPTVPAGACIRFPSHPRGGPASHSALVSALLGPGPQLALQRV